MEDNVELELIKQKIEYFQSYRNLLEEKKGVINGLIATYDTSKHDSVLQKLQFEYEIVKLKIEEFEIDAEIIAQEQVMNDFKSRQQEHLMMRTEAEKISGNLEELLNDANGLIANPVTPPQFRDILKSMANNLNSPDFIEAKQSDKDRALINLKMQVDSLKARLPQKKILSRV